MTASELAYGWPRGTIRSIVDGLSGPTPLAIDLGEGRAIHRALETRFAEIEPRFDADLQDLLLRAIAPIAPLAEEPGDIDGVLIEVAAFLSRHGGIDGVIAAGRRYGDYREQLQIERDRMPGYVTKRAFEIADEMSRKCKDCSMATPMAGGRLVVFLQGPFMGVHHWAGGDPDLINYMVPIQMEYDGGSDERVPDHPLTV